MAEHSVEVVDSLVYLWSQIHRSGGSLEVAKRRIAMTYECMTALDSAHSTPALMNGLKSVCAMQTLYLCCYRGQRDILPVLLYRSDRHSTYAAIQARETFYLYCFTGQRTVLPQLILTEGSMLLTSGVFGKSCIFNTTIMCH